MTFYSAFCNKRSVWVWLIITLEFELGWSQFIFSSTAIFGAKRFEWRLIFPLDLINVSRTEFNEEH